MRILVIGGTGFVGNFLVGGLLDAGHEVIVVHRGQRAAPPDARVIIADRRQLSAHASSLRACEPDIVIDLVLSSGRQAAQLMDVFRHSAGRVVAITSMDVYRAVGILHRLEGEKGELEPLPLHEESRLRTRLQTYPAAQIDKLKQIFGWLDDEYDKIPVERAVLGDRDLPATILRLPMIYGPGDPLHRFRPILKRIDDGLPAIVIPASVAQWRSSRGYVENVAAAIALAATSSKASGRIYNVAEEESFSELEWTRLIAGISGRQGRVVVIPDDVAPAHLRWPSNLRQHWVADSSRIRNELGYSEPIERPVAIRRTIDWERSHPPQTEMVAFDYAAEAAAAAAVSERP